MSQWTQLSLELPGHCSFAGSWELNKTGDPISFEWPTSHQTGDGLIGPYILKSRIEPDIFAPTGE